MAESLKELINTNAHLGRLVWIGLQAERRASMQIVEQGEITADGLRGDHASKGREVSGKRGITLIQHEHLAVIGAFLHRESIDPARLRRNLVISGINLLAMKGRTIRIGAATLAVTGPWRCDSQDRRAWADQAGRCSAPGRRTHKVIKIARASSCWIL